MPSQPQTRSSSRAAPVGGWNARDALADMPETDAIVMDNWFPSTDQIKVRPGFTSYATGIGSGAVETLMTYTSGSASKMFACGNGGIYDVSSTGAVGAAAVSSLASNRWEYVNFGTAGGAFLICVNGSDAPQIFDGTNWAATTITGPTLNNLAWINVAQSRLLFGEKNSLKFWYMPVNTIGGAASSFDLSGTFRLGGYLAGMVTWSRDGGGGMQDLCVFMTSEGEVAVYQGIDPSSATTWARVGTYRIGKPIGTRFAMKLASDAAIITQDGFVQLSRVLPIDRLGAGAVSISEKINTAVNNAIRSYGSNFGWQPLLYPKGPMLIFNIPAVYNKTAYQYVFNNITGAACRFTGMNANCWVVYKDNAYFGGTDGKVYLFDNGYYDNGNAIYADVKPAFSYFGETGRQKLFKMARPVFSASGSVAVSLDMNLDFDDSISSATPSTSAPSGGTWGSAVWGIGTWAAAEAISKDWQSVTGVGYCATLHVRVSVGGMSLTMRSTDFVYEAGGIL